MRVVVFLVLSAVLPAQNLVVNGNFETGDLAGWTVTSGSPMVQVLPINGGSVSLGVAHVEVPPCHPVQGARITQRIPIVTPGTYELRFDYLAAAGLLGGGYVGTSVGNATLPSFWATPTSGVVRGQYTQPVNLQSSVDLQFNLTAGDCGGAAAVDNVSIRPARDVRLGAYRFRILGFPTFVPAWGTAGAICYLLVGFAPAAVPISIPGFSGDVRLDPRQAGVFAIGTLDGSGYRRFYVTPPANPSLAGVDLYWQAAQFHSSGLGAFSWETLQPFWM